MKYFVYIIRDRNSKKHYTGITDNPSRRLNEHSLNKGSTKFTKNKHDFILLHLEECESRLDARQREIFWKRGYGRELRSKISKDK